MSSTPLWERLFSFLFLPVVLAVYGFFALRALRPLGGSWGARVRAALAKREASVLFDSARVVVFAAWMGNTPDLELVVGYLRRGVPWCQGYGVFQWLDVLAVPPAALVGMVWIYRAALALLILGIAPRAMALVAALCHATMWSIAYSTSHGSVHNHAVFMILVSIALLPEPLVPLRRYVDAARRGQPLSQVGSYPAYARFAAMFVVATVYVETGIEKMQMGGLRWFNGLTLQGYVMRKGEISTSLAAMPPWVFALLAVGVVAWETGYGAALFRPRLRPLAVLTGWMFHEWIRWGMGVWPFFFMEAAALFMFTPYEAVEWVRARKGPARGGSGADRPAAAPVSGKPSIEPDLDRDSRPSMAGLRSWRLALLAVLVVVQWVPTGVRHGVYPFASNAMFSGALEDGDFLVGGARIMIDDGAGAAREISPEAAVSIRSQRWNELIFEQYLSPYKDHRRFAAARPAFCETLLREIAAYAEPRATRVEVWMDHFNAGRQGMRTKQLGECGAGGAPGGAAAAKSASAASVLAR